ncbi:MAG: AhpC/TSA family protein [Rhodospirillaceae bacterium]|nr:MAG: AhpC/TSA family protein [Rhodospirillaceae bacterium]
MTMREETSAAVSKPLCNSKSGAVRTLRDAAEYLIASRLAERALTAGSYAPTFCLPNQNGTDVTSESLLRRGPLLLTFYSGTWCPACSLDLQALEKMRPAIEQRGAALLSISQQTVAENLRAQNLTMVKFPILSDRGGRVTSEFGVRWRIPELLRECHRNSGIDLPSLNGEESWTLPMPARFVIDRAGIIAYSEISPDPTRRFEPEDILPVLDFVLARSQTGSDSRQTWRGSRKAQLAE